MNSRTKIEIRFSDIDMAGHVHNGKYLCFFEQGRMDFLSKLTGQNWNWRKKGLILGRNEVDYLVPIYLKDEVYVNTTCDHVGNKSFTLSYQVVKIIDNKEIICTKGRSILICMDYEINDSVPIFESWKNNLMESIE
ncbi:MAG: acyl-CoA thioesterase [Bacteroidota bacterium]|nr:acyl-CoA thioesterase [Bacteroidota bacterium]MEC8969382.1 acyl-CoA thioesterase [Bacteroidota bacterium]|tara:strand:- start:152 stop:559 length:408 start_codon:yes stop_codon:yes gene_type:complete